MPKQFACPQVPSLLRYGFRFVDLLPGNFFNNILQKKLKNRKISDIIMNGW
jgi:hypothetical protein